MAVWTKYYPSQAIARLLYGTGRTGRNNHICIYLILVVRSESISRRTGAWGYVRTQKINRKQKQQVKQRQHRSSNSWCGTLELEFELAAER